MLLPPSVFHSKFIRTSHGIATRSCKRLPCLRFRVQARRVRIRLRTRCRSAVDANGLILTWTTPEQVLVLALGLDGREAWSRDLGPFIGGRGSGSSPILSEDLVVLANDQEDPSLTPGGNTNPPPPVGKSFLVALDRKSGRTGWQIGRRTSFAAYSTPCLYPSEGKRRTLIFTNAVGAMNPGYEPGDLMVATDHINFIGKRDAQMAVVAARRAMQDAAIVPDVLYSAEEIALYGATGLSGMPVEEISRLVDEAARSDGRETVKLKPNSFTEVDG